MTDSFQEYTQGLKRQRAEVFDTLNQLAVEREAIKTICRELDMGWVTEQLYELSAADIGESRLRLVDFRQAVPDFPFYLVATKLKPRKTASKKFRSLTVRNLLVYGLDRQECLAEYRELLRELPDNRRQGLVALIFNIPYVAGGVVLHNGPVNLVEPGLRITWQSPEARTALALESVSSLCKAIRPQWKPSG